MQRWLPSKKRRRWSTNWARRRNPDPPLLSWQGARQYCLADLIEFAPELDEGERAGIEAALESSGLLSARLADGALELASGDLIALANGGSAQSAERNTSPLTCPNT